MNKEPRRSQRGTSSRLSKLEAWTGKYVVQQDNKVTDGRDGLRDPGDGRVPRHGVACGYPTQAHTGGPPSWALVFITGSGSQRRRNRAFL